MHIWPSKPCGKSIRQVLQTIIIDVVQRCPILPESAYYSRRQREMLKDIHEYIIQTFNMLYAERLIWYCFGALDLTFNPWGTLYKIKTTCVFMFTFKHSGKIYERKSAILTYTKDNISTAQYTKGKWNDLCTFSKNS